MAEAFANGRWLSSGQAKNPYSMRPPIYPLLLAVVQALSLSDVKSSIVVAHVLITAGVLFFVCRVLKNVMPTWKVALGAGAALYATKPIAWAHMSEWVALSLLFAGGSAFIAWNVKPSARLAFSATALISGAVLTRIALTPFLLLPALLMCVASREARRATFGAVLMGLLPLLVWSSLNVLRLGSFGLGPHSGCALAAGARTLGPIPIRQEDSPLTVHFLDSLNTSGISVAPMGWAPSAVHKWDGEYYAAYHRNFDASCGLFRALPPKSVHAFSIFVRAVAAYPHYYRAFLAGSVYTFCSDYALLFIAAILVILTLVTRRGSYRNLSIASALITITTLCYTASIFLTILWVHRYIVPVQPIMLFITFLPIPLIVESFRPGKTRSQRASLEERDRIQ